MNKPREFWITESRCTGKQNAHKTRLECWNETQPNDNEFHVIEYSAYDSVVKERDAYAKAMAIALENGVFYEKERVRKEIEEVLKGVTNE